MKYFVNLVAFFLISSVNFNFLLTASSNKDRINVPTYLLIDKDLRDFRLDQPLENLFALDVCYKKGVACRKAVEQGTASESCKKIFPYLDACKKPNGYDNYYCAFAAAKYHLDETEVQQYNQSLYDYHQGRVDNSASDIIAAIIKAKSGRPEAHMTSEQNLFNQLFNYQKKALVRSLESRLPDLCRCGFENSIAVDKILKELEKAVGFQSDIQDDLSV